jgi:uncharacterized membrane protein
MHVRMVRAAVWRESPLALWAGIVCFVVLYTYLDFNKLYALRYGSDVGTFVQSLLNFARSGSTFNWPEHQPHLAVHDSWALLAFAPVLALVPRPETLIVIQVLALALAALPLYAFARGCGLGAVPAQLVALAYLISPSAQGFAYIDFSENVFVPLLAFSLALAAQRRSLIATLVLAQLLMGVKEDQIWFLVWFGVAGALWYDRRLGWSVAALAAINAAAYYGIIHVLGYSPVHPSYGPRIQFWRQDLAFILEILAPFAFAPLTLGWRIALATPLVAEITMNEAWNYPMARAGTHYSIPLVTLVVIGAAAAIARRPVLARAALACSCIMALFFNVTVLHLGRHLYQPETAAYEQARRLAQSSDPHIYTRNDEGAFVVASPNVNVRLVQTPDYHAKPEWNTR